MPSWLERSPRKYCQHWKTIDNSLNNGIRNSLPRTTQRTAPADIAEIKPPIKVKFGTAGIRGLFGHDVSVRETVAVCFAVNELMGEGRFGLAYDSRDSSFVLATTACSAMNWYGSDVENYGMVPTPVLAYNIRRNKLHAGFSVLLLKKILFHQSRKP